ncbi:MAG: DegV family protein [Eubacteriales bacterium]|nr:DegV family protein [Eubacteriales bacterium]
MNYKYKILTDFSVDITPEFAAENDIGFIPMSYTIGDEEFNCDHVETEEERRRFYKAQREGVLTHTAQSSIQSCIDTFEKYASQGMDILSFSLSSGLSGSYSSACLAASEVMEDNPGVKIVVIDSLSATGGLGLLLELAAKNRADGMSIDENADWLNANKLRIMHWFMVDDLMFLQRGGRLSVASALLGTAFSIKPILKIEADGTLTNFIKKRSTKQAMAEIIRLYDESSYKNDGEIVYVIHADAIECAEYLKAEVLKLNPAAQIRTVQLSPVIGAHTGPGMCAVVNFSKPEFARG